MINKFAILLGAALCSALFFGSCSKDESTTNKDPEHQENPDNPDVPEQPANKKDGIYVSALENFLNEKLNAGISECDVILLDEVPDFDVIKISLQDKKYQGIKVKLNLEFCTGIKGIRDKALEKCGTLTSVKLPNTIINIGEDAFVYCSNLKSITLPDVITSIGNSAFACSDLSTITLPTTLTSIGDYAFSECDNLTSITIPKSVTYIGADAFFCRSLTSLKMKSENPPSMHTGEMELANGIGIFKSCTIYVPISAVDTYENAVGWEKFKDQIVGY